MPPPFAPCDVVARAEFDGWETAAMAEARALFFLASWIERGGGCPLHLSCVGEPPPSVRALAEQAGARVRVGGHPLDAPADTGRVLLVSAETIVLRSPAEWDGAPVAAELLLVPANKPPKPSPDWPTLYAAAGAPAPKGEPFYQAGALWTSDPLRLRERWEQARQVTSDERVALTLAAAFGSPGRLPDAYCARLTHWETGALAPGDTALLQAAGLFQGLIDVSEIRARLEAYGSRLDAAAQAGFSGAAWWTGWRARRGALGVRRLLRRLFRRHVGPALRASGAYV